MSDNILDSEKNELDNEELNIRPSHLEEYIGQSEVKENIKVFIEAALIRNESLDHVLLYGPPGLGKTTLAFIIANLLMKYIVCHVLLKKYYILQWKILL